MVRRAAPAAPWSGEKEKCHEPIDPRGPCSLVSDGGDGTDVPCLDARKRGSRVFPQVPDILPDLPLDLPEAQSVRHGFSPERVPPSGRDGGAGEAEARLARSGRLRADVAGDGLSEQSAGQRSLRPEREDGKRLRLE